MPTKERRARRWARRPAVRYTALALAGLAGLAGIILLIWRVPQALYTYVPEPKDRAAAEASTRTGLVAGLAGLGALGGLAMAFRTYRLTQQGQITDRYTTAIEQLGSDKLDVRLGGIYALERIAVDSKRDHPTVVEVLSAFVRQHSNPAPTASKLIVAKGLSAVPRGDASAGEHQPESGHNVGAYNKSSSQPRLARDVEAAVKVLGRLPHHPDVRRRGDLTGAYLAGVHLDEANLSGAHLNGADLSNARLYKANLSDAYLSRADLSNARLQEANLSNANLIGAKLPGAWLIEAKLPAAWLIGARLPGAHLDEANLSGAHLNGADLSGAWLNGADLRESVNLTRKQLLSAHGNAKTRLPAEIQRPNGWGSGQDSTPTSS